MRRPLALLTAAAAAAAASSADAQPPGASSSPYAVTLEGPDPPTGLGVAIPVRIAAAPGGAAVAGARVVRTRLVSPAGAALPIAPPPPGSDQAGVYPFRGDLPLAGAWTLSFTVVRPGVRDAPVSLTFPAAAPTPPPLPADARAPAITAPDPALSPAPPAVVAPGPPAPTPR